MKKTKRIAGPIRRQGERVALTREKILSSARTIFARDGFEAARLEEIAFHAGYTRGAFYANFKNKEDLFVAVAGQQIENHLSIALGAVRSGTDLKSKTKELLQQMSGEPETRIWVMLMIEFSLFILRHPRRKKHLAALNDQLIEGVGNLFEELHKETGRNPPVPLPIMGIGFYSLVQALVLQEMLNDDLVKPKVTNDLLGIYLRAVLGDEAKRPA